MLEFFTAATILSILYCTAILLMIVFKLAIVFVVLIIILDLLGAT